MGSPHEEGGASLTNEAHLWNIHDTTSNITQAEVGLTAKSCDGNSNAMPKEYKSASS